MRHKSIKKLNIVMSLVLLFVFFNSIFTAPYFFSTVETNLISFAQIDNLTKNDDLNFDVNYTALSLIPLMIEEMKNTNATSIPIEQVINATPSNVTAIQSISKNSSLDNNTDNNNNFSSLNQTKDLIPVVVNLTKNTNASSIPIEQVINATPSNVSSIPIEQVINATPSNVTAIQSISKNSSLDNNTDNNNNFSSLNQTKDLIPVVVNLTKNTNATDIALEKTIDATPSNVSSIPIEQVINATPSNVTAIQSISKNSSLDNNTDNNNNFSSLNQTKDLIPVVVNLTKNTNATDIALR